MDPARVPVVAAFGRIMPLMRSLNPDSLTWAALLGQWVDYARASVALPDDAEGFRHRESVAAVINLQAVTFALGDFSRLAREDRAVARDKATTLIRENAAHLESIWRGAAMPPELAETITDARQALADSIYIGAVEFLWPGPDTMVMPPIQPDLEAGGTLAVMQPGTIAMPGEPVAWCIDRDRRDLAEQLAQCEQVEVIRPRQIYRQTNEHGRLSRDVMAPITMDMPPGFPLLVPLLEEGRIIGEFTLDPDEWENWQRDAMDTDQLVVDEWVVDEDDE